MELVDVAAVVDKKNISKKNTTATGQETGQSPIALERNSSLWVILPAFKFNGYDKPLSPITLSNNGETAKLDFPTSFKTNQIPSIGSGGLLLSQYRFAQMHFHWGSSTAKGGSEHTLEGKRYAAELHLVHYNTKYGSITEAINYSDGLAVIGVLMDVGPKIHIGFGKIVNGLSKVKKANTKTTLPQPLRFDELLPLPKDRKNFFQYHGSLTTPQYQQIVTWTVFEMPISVSESQVSIWSYQIQIAYSIYIVFCLKIYFFARF